MTLNVDVPHTLTFLPFFSVSSRRHELQLPYPSIIIQQHQYAFNAD